MQSKIERDIKLTLKFGDVIVRQRKSVTKLFTRSKDAEGGISNLFGGLWESTFYDSPSTKLIAGLSATTTKQKIRNLKRKKDVIFLHFHAL